MGNDSGFARRLRESRWLRIGLLALSLFVVNAVSRLVTEIGDFTEGADLDRIGYIALGVVVAILIGAGAWWAVRYPFAKLLFDIGAAVIIAALLSLLIGPLLVGNAPFADGLGYFVGQFLLFLGLGLVGGLLGFAAMVTMGKDWKSRGLRQYELAHQRTRTPRR